MVCTLLPLCAQFLENYMFFSTVKAQFNPHFCWRRLGMAWVPLLGEGAQHPPEPFVSQLGGLGLVCWAGLGCAGLGWCVLGWTGMCWAGPF